MTPSVLFFACLTWITSHPAEVTLAAGAIVSCFYNKLSKYPRVQAVFSLMAHLGINVPGVAGALAKIFTRGAAKMATKIGVVLLLVHCGAMTAQDHQEVATYAGEQSACVAATPTDRAAIDACRAKVRAHWCAQWAARFDAGVCQ